MEKPPTDKPPWKARNARDAQAMIDFVVAELLAEAVKNTEWSDRQLSHWDGTVAPEVAVRAALYQAKTSARAGDLGPIRALLPGLAEFLHEPKRVRGQRRPHRQLVGGNVFSDYAAEFEKSQRTVDIERVREIWRREYNGRWKRHRGERPNAEEIVDEYYARYGD
jgi:hypothetical protein